MSRFYQSCIVHVRSHDDSGRIEVVIQRLGLPQKFRTEDDVPAAGLFPNAPGITYRNGGLDDHNGIRIILHDKGNDRFYSTGVKEIFLAVIIGRGSNDHKICISICRFCVQRCRQIQFLFCKVFLNVIVLNRGLLLADQFDLFRYDVYRRNFVVLGKQCGNG